VTPAIGSGQVYPFRGVLNRVGDLQIPLRTRLAADLRRRSRNPAAEPPLSGLNKAEGLPGITEGTLTVAEDGILTPENSSAPNGEDVEQAPEHPRTIRFDIASIPTTRDSEALTQSRSFSGGDARKSSPSEPTVGFLDPFSNSENTDPLRRTRSELYSYLTFYPTLGRNSVRWFVGIMLTIDIYRFDDRTEGRAWRGRIPFTAVLTLDINKYRPTLNPINRSLFFRRIFLLLHMSASMDNPRFLLRWHPRGRGDQSILVGVLYSGVHVRQCWYLIPLTPLNVGYTLTPDGMISFQRGVFPLLILCFVMVLG
jgi:hypothetical protein